MAKRLQAAAVGVGLAVLPLLGITPSASAADKVATIDPTLTPVNLLNINDFHGRIDGGSLDGKLGKQVACTIQKTRASLGADKTVFLSAGDNVGASTFASFIANDQPTIDFLNALDLKTSAVGNHEFDQGAGDLTGRIIPAASWTYLGANVYQRGTTTPALPEYKVLTVNGVRVGVIGAVTTQTPNMVAPSGVSSIDFGDPIAAVNRVADKLVADNLADIIVAEYHDGASAATSLADQTANSAIFNRIVNETSQKVSVIFNGHTHVLYGWDGTATSGTRPVLEAASYGAYVGQVSLGYDPATKTVKQYYTALLKTDVVGTGTPDTACAGDPTYVTAATIAANAAAAAKVLGAQVIGHVSADITRAYASGNWSTGVYGSANMASDDRLRESALSNLEAEVWKQAMNVPGRPGADLGVQNPGGVRADLKYAPSGAEAPGDVTYAEAAAVNPFANTLVTLDLTGAQLKTVLEQQWQPTGSSRPILHLGLSKNVRFTFDETRASGDKVTGIWVNDVLVTPSASFRVATNSFLAGGGDNFLELANGKNTTDTGQIDMDAFITYLKNAGTLSPDFAKQGVEAENVPATIECGTPVSFKVQGWDMTSIGAPQNTAATVSVDGVSGSWPVTITPGTIAGVPTLDGTASVSFTLPSNCTTNKTTQPAVIRLQATTSTRTTTNTVVTLATQLIPSPAITTTGATTTVNRPLPSITPQTSGGKPTLTFSATGLPTGVTIDAATGVISGTPTATGEFPYEITVTDAAELSAKATALIKVNAAPVLWSPAETSAQEGDAIMPIEPTVEAGTGPFSFSATGLPSGVTIDPATGVISGASTEVGTFPYVITVTDAAGATTSSDGVLKILPNVANVTGRIFDDVNRDGVYQSNEPMLEGVTVKLVQDGQVVATTMTHSPYLFTKVADGTYTVKVVKDGALSNYTPCKGVSWEASVTVVNPDSPAATDFAFCRIVLPQTGSTVNPALVALAGASALGAGVLLFVGRRRRES